MKVLNSANIFRSNTKFIKFLAIEGDLFISAANRFLQTLGLQFLQCFAIHRFNFRLKNHTNHSLPMFLSKNRIPTRPSYPQTADGTFYNKKSLYMQLGRRDFQFLYLQLHNMDREAQ